MLIRRLTWITFPTAVALASACGGNAFTTMEGTGGTSGSGASSGSGGNGSGAAGSGGDGSGGSGSGGDGSGGSGSGGTFSFDRECFSTLECELVDNTCCGTCEPPTLDNVMAVTVGQTSEIADALCTDDADCPDCEPLRNPNLFAACVEGTCEALDLTMHEDASCEVNDDCVIIPAACCPCEAEMGPGAIVAANQDAATFKEAQCETTPICGCDPDFVFMPPPDLVATCQAGFCVLPPPPDAP